MTNDSGNPEDEKPRPYRNPPIEHRFKKGQSGNPKGRPRKNRGADDRQTVLINVNGQSLFGWEDPIMASALKEAYRQVSLANGQHMPLIDLLMRQLAADAVKGNPSARKQFVALVVAAETGRRAAQALGFEQALALKKQGEKQMEPYKKSGSPLPDIVPHPDDIILNFATQEVKIFGPMLHSQRDMLDDLHAQHAMIKEELRATREELKANPRDKQTRLTLEHILGVLDSLNADDAHWRLRQKRKAENAERALMAPQMITIHQTKK